MLKMKEGICMLGEAEYIEIGKRIRGLRKRKGWSQAKLAEQCGYSTSFQGHIERGVRLPSVETIAKIAFLLNVSIDELIYGPEKYPADDSAAKRKSRALNDARSAFRKPADDWPRDN